MSIIGDHLGRTIGDPVTRILSDISLKIEDGEFVALTGRSGSGKSSLLYVLSSLDRPSEGTLKLDGKDVSTLTSDELHSFRNLHMGFVFQFHYLISELTAFENVMMPTRKFDRQETTQSYAESIFERFNLLAKKDRYPHQLSGGEQQRIAIARALVMKPRYIFADEPTGSLDTANADTVMTILRQVNKTDRTTVILVTHDPDFANQADRKIELVDGRIVRQSSLDR